jgi:hypothetical protein
MSGASLADKSSRSVRRLDGTDHPDHDTQARLIAGYIDWRNQHRDDPKLRHLTRRQLARKTTLTYTANVA